MRQYTCVWESFLSLKYIYFVASRRKHRRWETWTNYLVAFRIEKLLNRWSEVGRWLYLPLHRTGLNSANPDWLSVQSLRATVTEDERIVQYDPWQCHASEGSLSETRRASCTFRRFVHQCNTFPLDSRSTGSFINTRIWNPAHDRENNFKLSYRVPPRVSPGRLFRRPRSRFIT